MRVNVYSRALLLAAITCISAPSMAERNVLLIVSDDQGRDAGCYGNPVIQTPNQDALAADGTLFTHAFATVASCSASRSVIQTGLFNHTNGQFGHQHSHHDQSTHSWVKGISKILAETGGYRTGIVGKNHVQPPEVYPWEKQYVPPAAERRRGPNNRNVAWMAEAAGQFFREKDKRPFFLLIGYSDPHRGDGPGKFSNHHDYRDIEPVRYSPNDVLVPHHLPDLPVTRAQLAEYYEAVSRLDSGIGMVLAELRKSGHYDDTLIIYISDNGIPFTGAKTNLYDPGIRLPLIVRSPEQKKRGVVSDAMVSWIDLVPTILDWTQVTWGDVGANYNLPGRSFLDMLSETHAEGWDEVYASHVFHEVQMYYPMRVVRTRTHKLILNVAHPLTFPLASDLYASPTWQYALKHPETRFGKKTMEQFLHRPKWELFDLDKDPEEVNNVTDDPDYAEVLEDLKVKLKLFQQRSSDPWITKYEYE